MSPEHTFRKWVFITLGVFAVVFGYFLVSDITMPVTTEALVTHKVTRISPRVAGRVTAVQVKEHQHVEAGDVLFQLDPEPYQLAVTSAQLAVDQVNQSNDQLGAQLNVAKANLAAAKADEKQTRLTAQRLKKLVAASAVSQQDYEQANAQWLSAKAAVDSARASIAELKLEIGLPGNSNLALRVAKNNLAQARLNEKYTTVRAADDGVVSNLQLKPGTYLNAGTSVLALVDEHADIVADFREKSLRFVKAGDHASIAFDGFPGTVYDATVTGIEAGVSSGQIMADGSLATPQSSSRWVRDAQRLRVHLRLSEPAERPLPAGARATVQLYPMQSGVWSVIGGWQIGFISLLHYVY